jgi:predicted Fe-Mo cluster-binding NifX family protein
VPTAGEGGLEAKRSCHFGKSRCFTLIELTQGEIQGVRVVPNELHSEGGCRVAAQLLTSAGVNALVAGGIGARPLAILSEAGIEVYFDQQRETVGEVIRVFAAGELRPIEVNEICKNHRGQRHEHSC